MKKIAKYFLAALVMTSAVSCAKELTEDFKPANKVQGKSYVFSAYMDDADTKAVLDENTMQNLWMGDENGKEYITVMEPNSVNTYVATDIFEPTAEATFAMAENGGTGITGKSVFAVYPAGAWSCFNTTDSLGVQVTYPNIQYAYAGTYDPKAAVAVAYNADVEADQHLAFKNTTALLKFQIQATSDPVFNVTVYSLAGEPISGAIVLKQKGEKGSISGAAEGAKSWVEISDKDLMPLDAETSYYIAVAPALLKGGIGVQLNKDEVQTFTISKELNIERNRIYDLGAFSYDAPADDAWYLIGDFNAGNASSIAKTPFEAAGDQYLVAKNVTIGDGQAFKVYNPVSGKSFYANYKSVAADAWHLLSAAPGYSYTSAGTYDVYVDYIDEEITGLTLVAPGADVPAFPVPAGSYIWNDGSYNKAINIYEDELLIGTLYSDLMEYAEPEYLDPSMIGKYSAETHGTNVVITPMNATSGDITMQALVTNMWSGETYTEYFIIRYSNLTDKTVDLYSVYGMDVPVYDENGEPVGRWEDFDWDGVPDEFVPAYYSGLGISQELHTDDFYGYVPVNAEYSKTAADITSPVPTTGQFVWEHYEDDVMYYRLFDLGVTDKNVIHIASNYDQMMMDPETGAPYEWADPRLEGAWLKDYSFDNYEIVPTSTRGGEIRIKNETIGRRGQVVTEYYLLYYSEYAYKSMINIHSPEMPLDEAGDPIPVLDENGSPVLDENGDPYYWMGLGLEGMNWMTGQIGGVYMQDLSWEFGYIEPVEAPATPDGAQWTFAWDAMGGLGSCLDLGSTYPGKACIAYSMDEAYGAENLPAELQGNYMVYIGSEYEIIPDEKDPSCGQINFITYNQFEEKQVAEGYYTDYSGTMFIYTCPMLMIDNAVMMISRDLPLYDEMGIGGM